MIINGNFYPGLEGGYNTEAADSVESLAIHMDKTASREYSDTVTLSEEALAALKEYAPDALAALGYNEEDPILEEIKEIAQEKYFHFGSQYLKLPETQDDMISALDVANRYIDALNSIEPDEIYGALEDENRSAASFDNNSFYTMQGYVTG